MTCLYSSAKCAFVDYASHSAAENQSDNFNCLFQHIHIHTLGDTHVFEARKLHIEPFRYQRTKRTAARSRTIQPVRRVCLCDVMTTARQRRADQTIRTYGERLQKGHGRKRKLYNPQVSSPFKSPDIRTDCKHVERNFEQYYVCVFVRYNVNRTFPYVIQSVNVKPIRRLLFYNEGGNLSAACISTPSFTRCGRRHSGQKRRTTDGRACSLCTCALKHQFHNNFHKPVLVFIVYIFYANVLHTSSPRILLGICKTGSTFGVKRMHYA